MKPSASKIESRALNALENVIDKHNNMQHHFNKDDKEMSWDGFISLYSDQAEEGKESFEGRIPVQIKGHHDYREYYIGKKGLNYSVELVDLKAYSTEKGVLYFQIFTYGEEKEIFYASLFPSRIVDYLEKAKKRGNTKTISIPFTKLERDPDTLYSIVQQFNYEATKQGSTYNPLVSDRIRIADIKSVTSFNFSVIGANNPIEVLKRLGTGDVCIQGKTERDKYYRPIEWMDGSKFFAGREVDQSVYVGEDLFYSHYTIIASSEGKIIMRMSPNLEIHITDGRFDFKCKSSIRELYRDARFIRKLNETEEYRIGEKTYRVTNLAINKESETNFDLIIDLYEVLEMLGFDLEQPVSYYADNDDGLLIRLLNIKNGGYNKQLPYDINRYLWKFAGKYVPIAIVKKEHEHENEIINEIYTDKLKTVYDNPDKKCEVEYLLPLFNYQSAEVLSNLYSYKYDVFYQQIDGSDINSITSPALLECALKLIKVFDANGDPHFLELAEYLLERITPYTDEEFILLNRLQIKKRKGKLSTEDINTVKSLNTDDYRIQFGISVILENKVEADKAFEQFTKEEKECYMEFPIFKFYKELESC